MVTKKIKKITDKEMREHFASDAKFQDEFRKYMENTAPMVNLFKENQIIKARIKGDTKTIIFYTGAATGVGGAIIMFLKFFGLWK